jgi:hypothetical protein
MKKWPVIVFAAKDDPVFERMLEQVSQSAYCNAMVVVKTDDDAIRHQELLKSLATGVALVDRKYARGVNLRFQTDAIVMVLANDEIGMREVQQMTGRGSRRFGLCQSKVFCFCGDMWGNVASDNIAETWLYNNDKEKNDQAHLIVKRLLDRERGWSTLTADQKRVAVKVLGKLGWQDLIANINAKDLNVGQWLMGNPFPEVPPLAPPKVPKVTKPK